MKNKIVKLNRNRTDFIRYVSLIIVILVSVIIFGVATASFFSFSNIMNISRQIGVLAIVSIGMTFVILTGGIDLSVGSNIAVSGIIGVILYNSTDNSVLAILATILCGALFGLINGIIVGGFSIPPFITTLSMMFVGRGATMLIGGAASIKIQNELYKFLGQGGIANIPTVLVVLVILYVIFIYISSKTVFCRYIYAIGGNLNAANASGIDVKKIKVLVYSLCGMFCGIGAVFTVGRMGSAQPYAGTGVEFSVITAVVLGGASLAGGIGNIKGTLLGAILVGVISNGLSLLHIDTFFEYIVTGLLILIAVLLDVFISRLRDINMTQKLNRNVTGPKESTKVSEVLNNKLKTVNMTEITKVFPGVKALDKVDLRIEPNQVHALVGENGAGKTTLMKILAGEEKLSLGRIEIEGQTVLIDNPIKARNLGITIIHQELSLVPELTVTQNLFLGREIRYKVPIFLNRKQMAKKAQEVISQLGLSIDVRKKAKELTVSEQQMIEIAKALETKSWLFIMDEPTSSLTENEKDRLFEIINKLKQNGMSIIYISHRIQEIFKICDMVTILRDGKLIGTYKINELDENKIITKMVGRSLNDIFYRNKNEYGEVVLEVRNLRRSNVFKDISFTLHKGEVLGFSGLVGAGRTEIARCIFGLDRFDSGEILLEGKRLSLKSSRDAIKKGIAYVTEDRKREGFIPFMSIRKNIALSSYKMLSKGGIVNAGKEKKCSEDYIKALGVKTETDEKNVVELSGGNQQKVSLAKWLATNPKVLILDEPTRGIDVGAKAEIHKIISNIASQGVAVVVISSEMPELIGCSDRIIVLREGRITAEFEKEEVTQDKIMQSAAYIEESV